MKRFFFRFSFFLLGMILILTPLSAAAEEITPIAETPTEGQASSVELSLPCQSAFLIETTTGAVLYEKNPDERLPIASVTKIMTLLLTMEAMEAGTIHLEDKVPISEYAASMGGSQVYLEPGEEITLHEILKAVFVSSANDGAVALAELISGNTDSFVAAMNDRAAELGMHNTLFCNPTGLDDNETGYSSARDVALMSKALLQYPLTEEYATIWIDSIRGGEFGLSNTNKMVRFYPGATGLKTGSTGKAKYCVSASARRNGLNLCAVVLAGESSADRFQAAKTLLDYGFANYAYFKPEESDLSPLTVWGGKEKSVPLYTKEYGVLLPKAQASGITREIELAAELSAPVEENQVVGKILYKKGDTVVHETPIYTQNAVEKLSYWDIFSRLMRLIFTGAEA